MGDDIRDQFDNCAKQQSVYTTKGLIVTGDEYWEEYIPLSHERALEILTRDLPSETEMIIGLKPYGRGDLCMWAEGIFEDSYSCSKKRNFDLEKGILGDGDLKVERKYQGSGLGRHVIRNQMEFFYLCNVRRFYIRPGSSAGGYTWARQGFVPSDVMNFAFIQSTKEPVQERYAAIRPYLDKEMVGVLDTAVKFEDPKDMWRIADCGPIETSLRSVFNAMCNKNPDKYNDQEAQLSKAFLKGVLGYQKRALERIKGAIIEGNRVTVGEMLLSGTDWYFGHVDMTDAAQMARVGNYSGGWKYISPGINRLTSPKSMA